MSGIGKSKSNISIKISSETVQILKKTENVKTDSKENSDGVDKHVIDSIANTQDDHTITKIDEIEIEEHSITHNEELNNVSTSNNPKKDNLWNDYKPFITYDGEVAVYTDPSTNIQYRWNNDQDIWVKLEKDECSEKTEIGVTTNDDRVYSYENDTHIYTEKDGSKFFWDQTKAAWFPKIDDDFLAQYQMNYGFIDNTSPQEKEQEAIKLNLEEEIKQNVANTLKRNIAEPPKWFDASEDYNTKVYVSNLPLDVTEEELLDIMQKFGLVMRDPITQKMKLKLYIDKETNELKGDALCTYIKIESVDLALKLLDGSNIRGNTITVQRAKFEMKGDYNPALKPKKKKRKEKEKLKKMQEKLFDWRPEKLRGERAKHERIVIIKNLFHPTDFDEDVKLILDYQEDLRTEFSKCGEVRKIILFDRHPEGVAQVNMAEPEEADTAVKLINGRWFGKRQLSAEIWDGRTKYKIAETDADINKRVDKWDKYLNEGEVVNTGGATSLDCDLKPT